MKYRRKTEPVDAIQVDGSVEGLKKLRAFLGPGSEAENTPMPGTIETWMPHQFPFIVQEGRWLVRDSSGALRTFSEDGFADRYEAVPSVEDRQIRPPCPGCGLEMAPRPPLKPRADWAMPGPPSPKCRPYAYLVYGGDGWELYWSTPEQAVEGDYWQDENGVERHIRWPFGEDDVAVIEDLKAVGFFDVEEV